MFCRPAPNGFGGANNLGASRAAGGFLCFLNPDAIVGPGWFGPLFAALDDPMVGIAAPVLVDADVYSSRRASSSTTTGVPLPS